jgi:catechol 2,3-dioxygenase-like lactoylglutathione lyase family enzyme
MFLNCGESEMRAQFRQDARIPRQAILVWLCVLLCAPVISAQTPPLRGIAHVAFRVADLDQSRAFYRALGFEQFLEFTANGKTSVSYMKVNDRQFIELYPRSEPSQPLGLMHVCYESNDLAAVHDAYIARGLTATDVKKAHAGNLLFVMHDPERQTVEYTQYEPGSLHSEDRGKHLGAQRISQRLLGATVPVHDLDALLAFYTAKLGFVRASASQRLRVPGDSGEFIQLVSAAVTAKPGITLQADDTKRAAEELRHRGLDVQMTHGSLTVKDPDGATITLQPTSGK